VTVVIPAGNGARDAGVADNDRKPINVHGAIVVGATTYEARRNVTWEDSNYGKHVTIWAPGAPDDDVTCDSSADDAYTKSFGGTSGAAAKVAGVVALMLSRNPSLRPDEIKAALLKSPDTAVNDKNKYAGKFLNAEDAVSRI
jgi:subtilisin family serine protease